MLSELYQNLKEKKKTNVSIVCVFCSDCGKNKWVRINKTLKLTVSQNCHINASFWLVQRGQKRGFPGPYCKLSFHLHRTSYNYFPSESSIITREMCQELYFICTWQQSWINCLHCTARFSETVRQRGLRHSTLCLKQLNGHEGQEAKFNCLWRQHFVNLWPLTFTVCLQALGWRGRGGGLGARGAVLDAWRR